MMHKLKDVLSLKAKLKLVNSLIISKFSYLISLWGNTSNSQINKAQICLNAAARFVTGSNRFTSKHELMLGCDWLDIDELTEYHSLLQIWKAVRWGKSDYLRECLLVEEEDILRTKIPRLQLTESSFRVKTVRKWNNLPIFLRTECKLKKFKVGIKMWIKERRNEIDPD